MSKTTPIGVRLNLKNFILISCAVMELLRKVSQGGRNPPPPPGEIGLNFCMFTSIISTIISTKFQINLLTVTLFSGSGPKSHRVIVLLIS